MAPDDRDRTFEKALARYLRPNAPGEMPSSQPACPDAENLAAYHERLLAPEQMLSAKEHIAGCARCQELLAQLEATDDLPVEVNQEAEYQQESPRQNVLTMPEADPAELAHAATQESKSAAARSTPAARWSRRLRARPGANWRWLAPAGALAAGLLVWVAVHESNPPQFQLAKNQRNTTPSPASAPLSSPAAPSAKESAPKPGSLPAAPPAARAKTDALTITRNQPATRDEKTSASLQADKLTALARDLSPKDSAAPVDGEAKQPKVAEAAGAEEKELKKQSRASVPAPASPAGVSENSESALAEVAPRAKAAASLKAKAGIDLAGQRVPQKEQQGVGATTGNRESDLLPVVNARASVTITAPGSSALWRIAPAGIILHSTDAGATWFVQTSGVVGDLLAGSAPSDQLCWIVGRAGTIVRTTDGGAHWRKIPAPINDDIAAVFAVNAQQASIFTASTHKTYKTTDAGQTWTPLPAQ